MNYLATTVSEYSYVNDVESLWNQKQMPTRDPKPRKKTLRIFWVRWYGCIGRM